MNVPIRQATWAAALLLAICALLIHQFTSRSRADLERARAQVVLRTLYDLEQSHYETYGTYLPIDRENNGELFQLNDYPGRFRYRVTVDGDRFVGTAEADLDGNGVAEAWQVDETNPEPVQVRQD